MASTTTPSALALAAALLSGCTVFAPTRDPEPPLGPQYLIDYREAFYRAQGNSLGAPVTTSEVLRLASERRVLLIGDLHRDIPLHGIQRDLLRRLVDSERPIALVLEAVGSQDDERLASFVRGDSDLDELREEAAKRWPRSWLEPSIDRDYLHWQSLVRSAKDGQWPIYGLEPTPRLPLDQRDARIANRLRELRDRHPDRILVAVLGQAHLAGAGSVGDLLGEEAVRILVRSSNALRDQVESVDSEAPFSVLPALTPGSFLLRDAD